MLRRVLPPAVAVAAMLLFALAAWWSLQARYDQFRPFNQDFADHLQSFWHQTHVGTAYTSITREHTLHHHFFLVFYPLMGLFAMTGESPGVLLAAQALTVAFSALPLWGLSRRRLGAWGAAWVTVAYAFFPALQFGTTFVFYSMPFGLLPFNGALYYFFARRWPGMAGCCLLLAMACHEAFFYAGIVLGLCLLTLHGHRRAGLTVALGSAVALFLVWRWFFPYFQTNPGYSGGREITRKFYGYLLAPGMSPAERFGEALREVLHPLSAAYAGQLLFPLLLLPLASPRFAAATLLTAAPYLVARFSFTREIYSYYALLLLPLLFLALIDGLARVCRSLRWCGCRVPAALPAALVAAACVAATVWASPWSTWRRPFLYYPGIYANGRQPVLAAAVARVPDEASLLTTPSLAEHLFRRRDLQVIFKENLLRLDTEYILVDLRAYNWIVDIETPYAPLLFAALRAALADGTYRVAYHAEGALLLQRAAARAPALLPDGLAAEFDRAFAQAFRAAGVADTAWCRPLFWNLEGKPTVEPVAVDGLLALPVAVGGFAASDRGFDRLRISAGAGGELLLADLREPGVLLPRIAPGLLPEGENRVVLAGEWRGGTCTTVCTVHIDRTVPVLRVEAEDGAWLVSAADTGGPVEAVLVDGERRQLLTPPLISEWLGEELGLWYHPYPGGVPRLRERLAAAPRPRTVEVSDRAGNRAAVVLPAGVPPAELSRR